MTTSHFTTSVLLAIRELDNNASTVAIRNGIEARTGRAVARGALYTTLARLEDKGWLRSRMGESTPVRGGKRKRYYRLTPAGVRALADARDALTENWRSLGRLLDDLP